MQIKLYGGHNLGHLLQQILLLPDVAKYNQGYSGSSSSSNFKNPTVRMNKPSSCFLTPFLWLVLLVKARLHISNQS